MAIGSRYDLLTPKGTLTTAWASKDSEIRTIGLISTNGPIDNYARAMNSQGSVLGMGYSTHGKRAWLYDWDTDTTVEIPMESLSADAELFELGFLTEYGQAIGSYLYAETDSERPYAFFYTQENGLVDFTSLLPEDLLSLNGWSHVAKLHPLNDAEYHFMAEVITNSGNQLVVELKGEPQQAKLPNSSDDGHHQNVFQLLISWLRELFQKWVMR